MNDEVMTGRQWADKAVERGRGLIYVAPGSKDRNGDDGLDLRIRGQKVAWVNEVMEQTRPTKWQMLLESAKINLGSIWTAQAVEDDDDDDDDDDDNDDNDDNDDDDY